jgi:glyoxylase-like metal-dependent hydrolase (beta-lactamase superfamily II)
MGLEKRSAGSGHYSRASFLRRAAASVAGAALASSCGLGAESSSQALEEKASQRTADSKIRRWAVITIGNLSRNRYWGESDDKGVRPAICTCTLIEGAGFRLLVDPSLENVEQMARELDRRAGLKLSDITTVFVTHEHADHFAGLAHFPQARWLAGPGVASVLNATKKWNKTVEPASGKLFDTMDVVPTPGHTLSSTSLRFDSKGLSVAVVGDAVATQDFWHERRGYFNCVDFELSAKSMDKIAKLADLVVPGHDNYFLSAGTK